MWPLPLLFALAGVGLPARAEPLPSLTPATRAGRPVGGLRCGDPRRGFRVHVELFEDGRVVLLPAGIGVAPPRRTDGAYVRGGRCRYPLSTREPTGVIEVARGGLRLRDLFAVWGRPVPRRAVVHLGGRRVQGPVGRVRLTPRAQIVVQDGGPYVRAHEGYAFSRPVSDRT